MVAIWYFGTDNLSMSLLKSYEWGYAEDNSGVDMSNLLLVGDGNFYVLYIQVESIVTDTVSIEYETPENFIVEWENPPDEYNEIWKETS